MEIHSLSSCLLYSEYRHWFVLYGGTFNNCAYIQNAFGSKLFSTVRYHLLYFGYSLSDGIGYKMVNRKLLNKQFILTISWPH